MPATTARPDAEIRTVLEIKELAAKGLSSGEIGERIALPAHRIIYLMRKYGVRSARKRRAKSMKYDPLSVIICLSMGMTTTEVAKLHGIATTTVRVWRMNASIPAGHTVRSDSIKPEKIAKAEQFLLDGASMTEAARSVQCSPSGIASYFPGLGWSKAEAAQFKRDVRKIARNAKVDLSDLIGPDRDKVESNHRSSWE